MAGKTPDHSPEFKRQIVALARSGQPQRILAREYGSSRETIRRWAAQDQPELNGAETVAQLLSERARNLLLLSENRQLREERKLLKQTCALFARDNGAAR